MQRGVILLFAAMVGCASASPPPGGPEDKAPPLLVRVTPDTNAVNVTDKVVQFYFDETINDRGTGAQELDNYFLVSPSDGATKLDWHRSRIDISPRHGFRPNTAYTITLLPGLADLRNNVMKAGTTIVFSTGPTIPKLKIQGVAFDWVTGAPVHAFIEAITPDSVVYLAQADSSGRFTVGPLTEGTYLVRAFVDANGNRALDARSEPYDTVRVTVPTGAALQLLTAPRDTLPARIGTPAVIDSVTLSATFDRLVDPNQPLAPSAFRLVGSDSVEVPIIAALSPLALKTADSVRARMVSDSSRRADSVAGKPLTPVFVPPAATPTPAVPGKPAPLPPPKLTGPSPFMSVTLKLGRALKPSTDYRLSTTGLRALSGRSTPSERRFSTPKPAPPKAEKDTLSTTPVVRVPARPPSAR